MSEVVSGKRILAIDDDPSMRVLVARILARAGCVVEVAAEGAEGLALMRERRPDLVLCDVQMPGMDGFRTLEAMRADVSTADLPFVLLTSLGDRDSVRRGMRLGADDFLSKPVRPEELVESVAGALDKRRRMSAVVSSHAIPAHAEMRNSYEDKLSRSQRKPGDESVAAGVTGQTITQTVMFCDIRGFTTISERLPVSEVAELLSRYLQEACKPILQEGGRIMKIMGDGLMAMFGQGAPEDIVSHASAALRAGHRIIEVASEFRSWMNSRFDLGDLPPFEVGVGIHTGQVMLFRLAAGDVGDLTAVGDTVNVASRLESKSKEIGWPVVASMATIEGAGREFDVAETRELALAGRDARIVVGRLAQAGDRAGQSGTGVGLTAGTRAVLDATARSAAQAAKEAIDRTLHSIEGRLDEFDTGDGRQPVIRGYRVLEKIGEGGMSVVYLAEDEAHARKAVLKVLKGRRGDDDSLWKRFFQECAILSSIDHEHIMRIYDQGFGEELAYIAMEYLGGGSLAEVMAEGLTPRQALSLLSQAASALAEIHACGVVHRDIKPANFLLRTEGVLVLTDFGVAKRLDQSAGQTLHGEVLGTPYYISPEQALGGEITPQADIYSLGVIFYEMLAGTRPYGGETILEILAQHAVAPIPRLPAALADFQGLVDGMLAKRGADRFQDAEALLAEIDTVWTRQALRTAA